MVSISKIQINWHHESIHHMTYFPKAEELKHCFKDNKDGINLT